MRRGETMDEPFDPYGKWLGITSKVRPVDYYLLLGIRPFESNPAAIARAADERIAYVATFQSGKYAPLADQLVDELAEARACLLDDRTRAEYEAGMSPPVAPSPQYRSAERRSPAWPTLVVILVSLTAVLCAAMVLRKTFSRRPRGDGDPTAAAPVRPLPPEPDAPGKPAEEDPSTAPRDLAPEEPPPAATQQPPPDPAVAPPEEPEEQNTPEETVPASAPTPSPPGAEAVVQKLPAPDARSQQEAEDRIRNEVYLKEFTAATTPERKLALASKLARVGEQTDSNPAARFALFRLAAELAVEAGNLPRALEFVDRLARNYQVDALGMKADALSKAAAATARTPAGAAARKLVELAVQLSDEALRQGELETSQRLLRDARAPARQTKDRQLLVDLEGRLRELDRHRARYARVPPALETLDRDGDDAPANLIVGAWYCLTLGDFEQGLPFLAKGDDGELAALARRDLDYPLAATEQIRLGDGWWRAGAEKDDRAKSQLEARAAYWYRQALSELSGFDAERIQRRLAQRGIVTKRFALLFDGEQSHVVVPNSAYSGKVPITLEAIVKAGNRSARQTVVGNLEDGGLALGTSHRYWSMEFCYATSRGSTRSVRIQATSEIDYDRWTHLAAVYDGRQIALFVDGQLAASQPAPGRHKPAAAPFVVGADPGRMQSGGLRVENFFRGTIRSVRVSNTARYDQFFEVPDRLETDRDTVLLLKFDGGEGTQLTDRSGRQAGAEIVGARWTELEEEEPDKE